MHELLARLKVVIAGNDFSSFLCGGAGDERKTRVIVLKIFNIECVRMHLMFNLSVKRTLLTLRNFSHSDIIACGMCAGVGFFVLCAV